MGKEVEAHVAKGLGLSLFRREEPVDGDSDYALSIYGYAPYCKVGFLTWNASFVDRVDEQETMESNKETWNKITGPQV